MKSTNKTTNAVAGVSLLVALTALPLTSLEAQAAGPSACIQAPAGLVSWWPGDGDATDIAGANNGTLVGGATFGTGFVTSGTGQATFWIEHDVALFEQLQKSPAYYD